jgi:hypothetical protein
VNASMFEINVVSWLLRSKPLMFLIVQGPPWWAYWAWIILGWQTLQECPGFVGTAAVI